MGISVNLEPLRVSSEVLGEVRKETREITVQQSRSDSETSSLYTVTTKSVKVQKIRCVDVPVDRSVVDETKKFE